MDGYILNKKTLAIIATSPFIIKHHLPSIVDALRKQYLVIVMINMSESIDSIRGLPDGVLYLDTKMERKIDLLADIRTALLLYKHLKRERVSIVYSVTPKAGLLGMCVARILKIPIRIHTFTGQVWQTKTGLLKILLKIFDKIIYRFASKVIVDSRSQRLFLLQQKIISQERSVVIGSGSLGGVNTKLFSPNTIRRSAIRQKMSVGLDNIVYLFVGRLDVDKGFLELVEAYSEVSKKLSNTSLWLVGPVETDIDAVLDLIKKLNIESVLFIPYTTKPETFMAAADVFCLPSRREGFGTVIIEAACCGIPAIGSRIYGLTDAIVDEETGLLVDMGDINALSEKMIRLGSDDSLREQLGDSAMKRAHSLYSQEVVVQGLLDFIEGELRHEAATN